MLTQFINYITEASLQNIYNKICKHLEDQGRSSKLSGSCFYQDGQGNKCAIGCLINDDEYDTSIEYKTTKQLIALLHIPIDNEREKFLNDMQILHDCSKNAEELIHKANYIATQYGLAPYKFKPDFKWDGE